VKWVGRADELAVLGEAFKLNKVPDGTQWVQGALVAKGNVGWKPHEVDDKEVPDLKGMALRDALYIMENKGYRVAFKGGGKVTSQSIPPGTKTSGPKNIFLTLQ
jgi:cell division protein FtsI (penicillin-binding protein 3)